jgi:hypothetical protein
MWKPEAQTNSTLPIVALLLKATCTREAEMQGKKGFHGIPLIFMELATTK